MNDIDTRSSWLLGEDNVSGLHQKRVAVFGLGGVGGTCFEALARSGVGHIHIIDQDVVDITNLNRQILFTSSDVGAKKALAAFFHAKLIRDDVEILPECYQVSAETLPLHDYSKCDFIIDAIDDIPAKVALIDYCLAKNIPFAISLGMGNRLDPSKVTYLRLDKTEGDPLAKKLRSLLRGKGIDLKKVYGVISAEAPLVHLPKPASMMMVPSAAGLLLASKCVSSLVKTNEK